MDAQTADSSPQGVVSAAFRAVASVFKSLDQSASRFGMPLLAAAGLAVGPLHLGLAGNYSSSWDVHGLAVERAIQISLKLVELGLIGSSVLGVYADTHSLYTIHSSMFATNGAIKCGVAGSTPYEGQSDATTAMTGNASIVLMSLCANIPRGAVLPLSASEFKLTRLLGAGAFGSVYEGVHIWSDIRVAVKIMRTKRLRRDHVRAEIEALAVLPNHPAILRYVTCFFDDSRLYLVTRLVEG